MANLIDMKLTLARAISRLFDPILVTPLLMWVIYRVQIQKNHDLLFMLLLVGLDLVLPGLFVMVKFVGRRMKDWDIKRREARIPLFIFGLISQFGGLVVTWWYGHGELFTFLLGIWVLLLVYLLVTYAYKISVHAGVNTMLAFMVTAFVSWDYWWLWFIPPVVSWSRLVVKQHSLGQVLLGMVVPIGVLFGVYRLLGLL